MHRAFDNLNLKKSILAIIKSCFHLDINDCSFKPSVSGGDERRSGYVRYVQGVQPNVPCMYYVHRDI